MRGEEYARFSRIVFDTAPTGHTLRLLTVPDFVEAALSKLIRLRKKLTAAGDAVRGIFGVANQDVAIQKLEALRVSVAAAYYPPTPVSFACRYFCIQKQYLWVSELACPHHFGLVMLGVPHSKVCTVDGMQHIVVVGTTIRNRLGSVFKKLSNLFVARQVQLCWHSRPAACRTAKHF